MSVTGFLKLPMAELDRLMPMHLVVSPTGHIDRVGPTLAKMRPTQTLVGARLLEVFYLRRPEVYDGSAADLRALAGRPLQLEFRDGPRTPLRGILAQIDSSEALFLNLTFGIAALAALDNYALSNSDFAATDLTFELLYLQEAKMVVEAEYQRLTARLETSKNEAEARALTDPLTGLGNRAAMERRLGALIRDRRVFTLMHLDLDLFKQVNDGMGHAAGDTVLRAVSERLRATLRETDVITRVGGDEFVLLLDGLKDRARLDSLCKAIIARIEEPVPFAAEECRISASIGYTISTRYARPQADIMLAHSDTALYAAKRGGRGRATAFSSDLPPMHQKRVAE